MFHGQNVDFVRSHYDDHRQEIYLYLRNGNANKIMLDNNIFVEDKEGLEIGYCLDRFQCDNEYYNSLGILDGLKISQKELVELKYVDYDVYEKFDET
jgi:hypothetical protein